MLHIKFSLNPTYVFGDRCRLKNSSMATMAAILDVRKRKKNSNFESLCRSDASHQVLAQSDLRFGRRSFEEFQDGRHGGHLGDRNGTILAILNLCNSPMPPIKFLHNLTWFGRRCRLKNLKMAPRRLSWLSERNDFSNPESLCHCEASHQVMAQSNLRIDRRYRLTNFKMATMAAILDIGTERF